MKHQWNKTEVRLFKKLSTPDKIQEYLETLRYNCDDCTRSPRRSIETGKAHCFDGAMLAAAIFEFHGTPPLLMDLRSTDEDDDHVVALFKRRGLWGAVAKSNYVGCRYREPVHRSLRELTVSYFNEYFNLAKKRTLREYSQAFDLRTVKEDWRTTGESLDSLGNELDGVRHYFLFPEAVARSLSPVDDRTLKGGTVGLIKKGAFKL